GQLQAAAGAHHQGGTDLLLQLGDVLGHRGLADVQGRGCRGERAVGDDLPEDLDPGGIDEGEHPVTISEGYGSYRADFGLTSPVAATGPPHGSRRTHMLSNVRRYARWLATAGAAGTIAAVSTVSPASADTAQPGHVYRITTNASLALDVSGASQGENAAVIQWPVNGGPNQSWRLQQLTDGSDYIINL